MSTDVNHAHRTGTNRRAQTPPAARTRTQQGAPVEGDPGRGARTVPSPGLPALDSRTAAEVAHRLVADALTGACVELGGEWFDATIVRIRRDPDGSPREVGLVVTDGTRGESILATILIASVPIGA